MVRWAPALESCRGPVFVLPWRPPAKRADQPRTRTVDLAKLCMRPMLQWVPAGPPMADGRRKGCVLQDLRGQLLRRWRRVGALLRPTGCSCKHLHLDAWNCISVKVLDFQSPTLCQNRRSRKFREAKHLQVGLISRLSRLAPRCGAPRKVCAWRRRREILPSIPPCEGGNLQLKGPEGAVLSGSGGEQTRSVVIRRNNSLSFAAAARRRHSAMPQTPPAMAQNPLTC